MRNVYLMKSKMIHRGTLTVLGCRIVPNTLEDLVYFVTLSLCRLRNLAQDIIFLVEAIGQSIEGLGSPGMLAT